MYIYIYIYIYIHTKDVETPAYTDTYMSARAQQPTIVETTWLLQCSKCACMSSDASNRCHRHRLSSISRHTSIALITLWAATLFFVYKCLFTSRNVNGCIETTFRRVTQRPYTHSR